MLIANKYEILEKINEGSFGSVFKAFNTRTKEIVAIKIESKSSRFQTLKNEAKIYQYLARTEGIPILKTFWSDPNNTYLVMELLAGPSLQKTIEYYQALSFKKAILLAKQMIEIIRTLHIKELLHRDIKPNNFVFKSNNEICLVDFGLCKRYIHNGIHIPEKNISKIIGSVNFVSVNVHQLQEPSRRDDLESCIYCILTMLFGRLEWFNKSEIYEIIELKRNILLVPDVPDCLKNILFYVRQLTFDETPNYEYILEEFNRYI
jgi:serine/threonine protein kinase